MLQGYLLRSTPSIEHVWCISCLKFIYSARLAGIGNSFYQANALCMLLKSLSTAYCEHILSDHLSFYLCFQSRECFVSFALLFYIRRTSIYEFIISSFLDKTKLSKSYLVLHVVTVKRWFHLASDTVLAFFQVMFRALTFLMNAFIVRYISKDLLGVVNVRLRTIHICLI